MCSPFFFLSKNAGRQNAKPGFVLFFCFVKSDLNGTINALLCLKMSVRSDEGPGYNSINFFPLALQEKCRQTDRLITGRGTIRTESKHVRAKGKIKKSDERRGEVVKIRSEPPLRHWLDGHKSFHSRPDQNRKREKKHQALFQIDWILPAASPSPQQGKSRG